jgi:hypothetical protein
MGEIGAFALTENAARPLERFAANNERDGFFDRNTFGK